MDPLLRRIDRSIADTIRISREEESAGNRASAEKRLKAAAARLGPEVNEPGKESPVAYAALCARLGELLKSGADYAHAAFYFQEAADALQSTDCEDYRKLCAAESISCVQLTSRAPEVRLGLMLARYEHQELQYTAADRPQQAAEARTHIALSLLRADRHREAVDSLKVAIELYRRSQQNEISDQMQEAVCLRRLADIYYAHLDNLHEAARCYREAAALFETCEESVSGRQEQRTLCLLALRDISDELEKHPETDGN